MPVGKKRWTSWKRFMTASTVNIKGTAKMTTQYTVTIEAGAYVEAIRIDAATEADARYAAMQQFEETSSSRMAEIAEVTMTERHNRIEEMRAAAQASHGPAYGTLNGKRVCIKYSQGAGFMYLVDTGAHSLMPSSLQEFERLAKKEQQRITANDEQAGYEADGAAIKAQEARDVAPADLTGQTVQVADGSVVVTVDEGHSRIKVRHATTGQTYIIDRAAIRAGV